MLSLKSQLEIMIQTYDAIFYQIRLQKDATLMKMILRSRNEENTYDNTNGQIIWAEDESDNTNKLSDAFWEKSKEEDIKIMICKEYKSKIFDLIRYLISSLSTNSYSINKSASSMVQSISECSQDKYQELVKFNWYWIRTNQLNDQQDTKMKIIEEELRCEKDNLGSLLFGENLSIHSQVITIFFWNRKNKSKQWIS